MGARPTVTGHGCRYGGHQIFGPTTETLGSKASDDWRWATDRRKKMADTIAPFYAEWAVPVLSVLRRVNVFGRAPDCPLGRTIV